MDRHFSVLGQAGEGPLIEPVEIPPVSAGCSPSGFHLPLSAVL
jgi:hypothetical protein